MFWYGPDRIDGIFFDTGSTRGPINYSQEEEDRDISSHTMLATYTKNLYRDHVLGQWDWSFPIFLHKFLIWFLKISFSGRFLFNFSNLVLHKVKFGFGVISSHLS